MSTIVNFGCAHNKKPIVTVTQQMGTSAPITETGTISVYPNPFDEGFYVRTDNQEIMISLFDLGGRVVLSQKLTGTGYIATGKLGKGIYTVELITDKATLQTKLVKR